MGPLTKREIPEQSTLTPPAGAMLLVVALVCSFGFNFYEMWLRWFPAWQRADLGLYDRFVEGESYYTHGPLVLLISAVMAALLVRYTRMEVVITRKSRLIGGLGIVVFMFLHLAASLARVNFLSGYAFVGVVGSLVLLIWGWGVLRRLWFAVFFLIFMVPLPEVTIAQVNFRMKLLATDWGVSIANHLLQLAVYQKGNMVFIAGDKSLVIANVCNGLRTLISLVAFGALYTYVCRLRGFARVLLFLLTIPIALIANTVRIVSLIIVADLVNTSVAGGWYHDLSSILIFVLAFVLMFLTERCIIWISRLCGRPVKVIPLFKGARRPLNDDKQLKHMWEAFSSWRTWVAGATIMMLSLVTGVFNRADPPKNNMESLEESLPRVIEINGCMMRGESLPIDKKTLTILENPSYLNRRYIGRNVFPIDVTIFFSRDNRKGIHPPDLCLEGIGYAITSKSEYNISGVPCKELIFEHGRNESIMIYTYKCGRSYTLSFWRQQFEIFLNGLLEHDSAGAMIRVSSPIGTISEDADREIIIDRARKDVNEMMEKMLPFIGKDLP